MDELSRSHSASVLFDNFLGRLRSSLSGPTTPRTQRPQAWHVRGLGCSPFARRYSGNRILLSVPGATEMSQFTPLTRTALCIQAVATPIARGRVVPSEISGSNACLRLTGAYRSLPRPLSPPDAKASTEHPSLLDRTHPTRPKATADKAACKTPHSRCSSIQKSDSRDVNAT